MTSIDSATVTAKPIATAPKTNVPAPVASSAKAPAKKSAPKAKAAAKPKAAAVAKPSAKSPTKPAAKPGVAKPAAAKPVKVKKPKMVRDSFTFPKAEYAVLDALKLRSAKLGHPVKKTELLRAGIKAIAAMQDAALLDALRAVPSLKTGRPANNK